MKGYSVGKCDRGNLEQSGRRGGYYRDVESDDGGDDGGDDDGWPADHRSQHQTQCKLPH